MMLISSFVLKRQKLITKMKVFQHRHHPKSFSYVHIRHTPNSLHPRPKMTPLSKLKRDLASHFPVCSLASFRPSAPKFLGTGRRKKIRAGNNNPERKHHSIIFIDNPSQPYQLQLHSLSYLLESCESLEPTARSFTSSSHPCRATSLVG